MTIHGRRSALLVALGAVFVVPGPGTALAGHDLGISKVEKQVDLTARTTTVELRCYPGDYAMDGMWRIDAVDQDARDLFVTAIGRAVDVQAAYPIVGTTANPGMHRDGYRFTFLKNATGRVQLKVFATCLQPKTVVNGHRHAITVDRKGPIDDPDGAYVTSPTCGRGEFVAQPGFEVLNANPGAPDPFIGHVWASYPSTTTTWSWALDLSQDATTTSHVNFYWSCVDKQLLNAGGTRARLVYRLKTTTVGLPAQNVTTRRIQCPSLYKAIVAGFRFPGPIASGPGWDPNPAFASFILPKQWWLGMDPQPRNRDFRFLNSDTATFNGTVLSSLCLNYRTT